MRAVGAFWLGWLYGGPLLGMILAASTMQGGRK